VPMPMRPGIGAARHLECSRKKGVAYEPELPKGMKTSY
jgi:hypothetical protein